MNFESKIKQIIHNSFIKVDKAIPTNIGVMSGCTTSIIIQIDRNIIYTANVGDSQSFIFSYDKMNHSVQLVYETKKHKADIPSERTRIERMGGHIDIPPVNEQLINGVHMGVSSRVVVPDSFGGAITLAMSRASKFTFAL